MLTTTTLHHLSPAVPKLSVVSVLRIFAQDAWDKTMLLQEEGFEKFRSYRDLLRLGA